MSYFFPELLLSNGGLYDSSTLSSQTIAASSVFSYRDDFSVLEASMVTSAAAFAFLQLDTSKFSIRPSQTQSALSGESSDPYSDGIPSLNCAFRILVSRVASVLYFGEA